MAKKIQPVPSNDDEVDVRLDGVADELATAFDMSDYEGIIKNVERNHEQPGWLHVTMTDGSTYLVEITELSPPR